MVKNGKHITVLGLGKSGMAAVELALKKGYSVFAADSRSSDLLNEFRCRFRGNNNIQFSLGRVQIEIPDCSEIVISPGIRPDSDFGRLALASGIPVVSELEFGLRFIDRPYLTVTGTNGKTTVTEMTVQILRNYGMRAAGIGNIGVPVSETALSEEKFDIAVVEASSFQLEYSENLHPAAAALLNIHSDHIDWHKNFTNYSNAKLKMFKNIKKDNCAVINYNMKDSDLLQGVEPVTFSYESDEADIYYDSGTGGIYSSIFGKPLFCGALRNFSRHNIENILAASALASVVAEEKKLFRTAVQNCIENFTPSPHRQELVAVYNGIKFINDSKSTNPLSLIAALDACAGGDKSVCLIAGGLDKQMDFSDVLKYKNKIKVIFLIGDSKKSLVTLWNYDIHCILCDTFKDAVSGAADFAESGDVVLLSPGCASMDMFENYQERGNVFRNLILNDIIGNKQMQMCSKS
jgi:UDP-N-acetylmuramoylalanine--D-glutamate ligase